MLWRPLNGDKIAEISIQDRHKRHITLHKLYKLPLPPRRRIIGRRLKDNIIQIHALLQNKKTNRPAAAGEAGWNRFPWTICTGNEGNTPGHPAARPKRNRYRAYRRRQSRRAAGRIVIEVQRTIPHSKPCGTELEHCSRNKRYTGESGFSTTTEFAHRATSSYFLPFFP